MGTIFRIRPPEFVFLPHRLLLHRHVSAAVRGENVVLLAAAPARKCICALTRHAPDPTKYTTYDATDMGDLAHAVFHDCDWGLHANHP